jgi:hypothetical protein
VLSQTLLPVNVSTLLKISQRFSAVLEKFC